MDLLVKKQDTLKYVDSFDLRGIVLTSSQFHGRRHTPAFPSRAGVSYPIWFSSDS